MINPNISMQYFQLYQQMKALEAEYRAAGKSISQKDKRRLIVRIKATKTEAKAMYREHSGDLPSFKQLRQLGL